MCITILINHYRVSVDIDVPLFLPLYGQRRLHDLYRIANKENKEGIRIQGQMNFDSGWEWGYWLNDVITARASWDPLVTERNEWDAYEKSLRPILHIFGEEIGNKLGKLLVKLSQMQVDVLIYGKIDGVDSVDVEILSGIAYISGSDTWLDVPRLFGLKFTQPDKLHTSDHLHPLYGEALRLLKYMAVQFHAISIEFKELQELAKSYYLKNIEFEESDINLDENECINRNNTNTLEECNMHQDRQRKHHYHGMYRVGEELNGDAMSYIEELCDSMDMLHLRTLQVYSLYKAKDISTTTSETTLLLNHAREILHNASVIVQRRELQYRVPWQRIGGWRENPTVYRFGYLWAVRIESVFILSVMIY